MTSEVATITPSPKCPCAAPTLASAAWMSIDLLRWRGGGISPGLPSLTLRLSFRALFDLNGAVRPGASFAQVWQERAQRSLLEKSHAHASRHHVFFSRRVYGALAGGMRGGGAVRTGINTRAPSQWEESIDRFNQKGAEPASY